MLLYPTEKETGIYWQLLLKILCQYLQNVTASTTFDMARGILNKSQCWSSHILSCTGAFLWASGLFRIGQDGSVLFEVI